MAPLSRYAPLSSCDATCPARVGRHGISHTSAAPVWALGFSLSPWRFDDDDAAVCVGVAISPLTLYVLLNDQCASVTSVCAPAVRLMDAIAARDARFLIVFMDKFGVRFEKAGHANRQE